MIKSRKDNLGGPEASEELVYAASNDHRVAAKRKLSHHDGFRESEAPNEQRNKQQSQDLLAPERRRSEQRVLGSKERGTPLFESTVTRGFLGIPKSEAETSLMVDLEDEASVLEVPAHISSSSNPLKLLAHASVTRTSHGRSRSQDAGNERIDRDRDSRTGTERTSRHALLDNDSMAIDLDKGANRNARESGFGAHSASGESSRHRPNERGDSSYSSQTARRRAAQDLADKRNFRGSTFQPVYDHDPKYDPITRGRMTLKQASKLIDYFYDHFSNFILIFDRQLSDLTYIRKHSCFLLTVMCAFASFYHSDDEYRALHSGLTEWYEGLLPAMLSGGFKSVEIAQACYVLASFEPFVNGAASDKSFLLLGTAIRMAGELGCNLRMYSYHLPKAFRQQTPESITKHRQLKNTERLWLSLWLFERTLHLMTGQSLSLNEDGPTAVCLFWHRKPLACPQDSALVGLIELRRIVAQRQCYYEEELRHPLSEFLKRYTAKKREDDVQASAMTREERDRMEDVKIRYFTFRDRAIDSLRNWRKVWISWSEEDSSDEEGSGNRKSTTKTPLDATGELHYYIAVLLTLSLPLKDSDKVTPYFLQDSFRDCFDASLQLLTLFRAHRDIEFMSNNMIISATYSCIFALDLAFGGRADFPLPRSHQPEDILNHCQELGAKLEQAGEKCINGRQSAAWQCGHYIQTTLARIRKKPGESEGKTGRETFAAQQSGYSSAAHPVPSSDLPTLRSSHVSSLDNLLMQGGANGQKPSKATSIRQHPQEHSHAWLGSLPTSMAQDSSNAMATAAAVFGAPSNGNTVPGPYGAPLYGQHASVPGFHSQQLMGEIVSNGRPSDQHVSPQQQADQNAQMYALHPFSEHSADGQNSSLLTPTSNGNSNQQHSVDSIFDLADLGMGSSGLELGMSGTARGGTGLGFDSRVDDGQFVPVLNQLNAMSFFINGPGQTHAYPTDTLTPSQHAQTQQHHHHHAPPLQQGQHDHQDNHHPGQ